MAEGAAGAGVGVRVSSAVRTLLQPGKRAARTPPQGWNRFRHRPLVLAGVFTSAHRPAGTLPPGRRFGSGPARSTMRKQPHSCSQPSPSSGSEPGVRVRRCGVGSVQSWTPHEREPLLKGWTRILQIASDMNPLLEPSALYWSQMLYGQRRRKPPSAQGVKASPGKTKAQKATRRPEWNCTCRCPHS